MPGGKGAYGHQALAGRRRQAALKGPKSAAGLYVPAAHTPRPNKALAKQFPAMAEDATFLPLVRAECIRLALGCYHTGVSVGSDEGYPDLTIWGPAGLILRELKGSTGRLAVVQLERIQSLRAAGVDADIWWPEDWHLGIVTRQLVALTRAPRPPIALPPLPMPGTSTPVRDPNKRYARCGCEIVDGRIPVHTCTWYSSNVNPWKATR